MIAEYDFVSCDDCVYRMERRVMLIVTDMNSFTAKFNPVDVSVSETSDGNLFVCATIALKLTNLLGADKNIVRYQFSSPLRML